MQQLSLIERIELLNTHSNIHGNKELTLAIEGNDTNLRIWIGRKYAPISKDNTTCIYMRLDCYQQYSCCLDIEHAKYVSNPLIHKLAEGYSFGETLATIENILAIVKDTMQLKNRKIKSW